MINDCLHTENTDGYGGPQADEVGESESSEFKRNLNGGPQADGVREQQLSSIGQQLKEKIVCQRMTRRDTEDDY